MDAESFVTLLVIVLALCFIFNNLLGLFERELGKPLPEPSPLPIVGNIFDVNIQNIHQSFAKMTKWYGAMFKVRVFRKDVIVISDSQLLKEMLSNSCHGDVFNDRAPNAYSRYITFSTSGLVLDPANQKTFTMRKMYTNALNISGDGNDNFDIVVEDLLKQFLKELSETNKNDFDINEIIRKSFGNTTSILLTGKHAEEGDWRLIYKFIDGVNLLAAPGNSFVYEFLPFVRLLPGKFRDYYLAAKNTRDALLKRYYSDVRDVFDCDSDGLNGFTGVLRKLQRDVNSKCGSEFVSEKNVQSLILDTVFAATETAASALLNSVALFIEHRDVVRKIQGEIDTVIGCGRLPRISDKSRMPYLMATIWEVLRYTSQVPLGVPHRVGKSYNFKGYLMPKHALVFANLWYIHHDPKIWHDPWEFRPERFLDSKGKLVLADHELMRNVLPFSTGGRKCPGEVIAISRLFLYIGSLLQSFDIGPASSGELPDNDPRHYKSDLGAMSVKDFMCRVFSRN